MIEIEYYHEDMDVYDITVKDNHNFYANGLVVHNCVEINLPTKPLGEVEPVRVFVSDQKDAELLTSYNRLSKMPSDLESLYSELPTSTHKIPVVIELDVGEIALCTLAAYNLGKIESPERFEELAKIAVRGLDNLLDYQDYPSVYALAAKKRRALGIGVTNYAYFLAKNFVKYTDGSARKLTHEWFEAMSYYNINASCELARERGANEWHRKTKWYDGLLPIDTYNKNVDELVKPEYKLDWERLRFKVLEYGMRHDTLSALMPCESSSVVSNSTNGIEPPRNIVAAKQNKDGVFSQVLPEADALAPMYELAWDTAKNGGFLDLVAIMQKFVDQGISANTYHIPDMYPSKKLPLIVMLQELAFCQKYGIKTLYYHNTNDGADVELDESGCEGCKI